MAPKRKWRKNDGKGVKRSNLRELRKEETSESEDEFLGFKYLDTQDNKKLTDKTVSILQRAQGYQDEFDLAGPSSSGVVPKPAPLENGDKEIVQVSNENNALQFLNMLTTEENNRLVDETWCINHSRIEVEPETNSDENPDDPESKEQILFIWYILV